MKSFKQLVVLDGDHPLDCLLSFDEIPSCQKQYGIGFKIAMSGQTRMILIKESDDPSSPMLCRAFFRLVFNEKNERVLVLDPQYADVNFEKFCFCNKFLIQMAVERAKELNLPLYFARGVSTRGVPAGALPQNSDVEKVYLRDNDPPFHFDSGQTEVSVNRLIYTPENPRPSVKA